MAKMRETCNAKEKERCPQMLSEKQTDNPKAHESQNTHHPVTNYQADVEAAAEVKPGNSSNLNATINKSENNEENSDK